MITVYCKYLCTNKYEYECTVQYMLTRSNARRNWPSAIWARGQAAAIPHASVGQPLPAAACAGLRPRPRPRAAAALVLLRRERARGERRSAGGAARAERHRLDAQQERAADRHDAARPPAADALAGADAAAAVRAHAAPGKLSPGELPAALEESARLSAAANSWYGPESSTLYSISVLYPYLLVHSYYSCTSSITFTILVKYIYTVELLAY